MIKDLDASRRRRILQETIEPFSARTVLCSAAGESVVNDGIVLSQAHDVHRRRYGADGLTDSHLVENVETWRMDGMSRQNLIARKSILVQK